MAHMNSSKVHGFCNRIEHGLLTVLPGRPIKPLLHETQAFASGKLHTVLDLSHCMDAGFQKFHCCRRVRPGGSR